VSNIVHSFNEQLAYSERASCEPFWDAVYKKAFPNLVNHMMCKGDTASQRMGVDRILYLANGLTVAIDEKKRKKDYGDILLEYVSVDTTGAPGWMAKDLAIDYLAYAIMPTKKCYLFPWHILRRVWLARGQQWIQWGQERKKGFSLSTSKNKGYVTRNVCVPIDIIKRALEAYSLIDVSTELSEWNDPGKDSSE